MKTELRMQKLMFLFLSLCLGITAYGLKSAFANNITVENVSLVDQDTTNNTYDIQFDLSWENSWRTAITPSATDNWDAAWVFAKYSVYDSGTETWGPWAHCTLSATDADHTAPTGSTIDTGTTGGVGKGIFIYRSTATSGGSNTWSDVAIQWKYGDEEGLGNPAVADDSIVKVKVFAIEMVYIPECAFSLNTAASSNMSSEIFDDGSLTQITNENALSEGAIRWQKDGGWGGRGNDNGTSFGSDALIGAYPKGFAAFYVMKYEISQGQYAAFLNTLTPMQDGYRSIQGEPNYATYRGTISGSQGSRTASAPERACNFLSWADIAAYADWAGLRPMTELEFEKAARGGQSVVTDEFAWGTANIASSEYTLENSGLSNEGIATNYSTTPNYGNCSYYVTVGSIKGPLRCGIFAAHASNTGRVTSGGSYYGVMELSGNLLERCVTIADQDQNDTTTNAGLFDGSHGDGALNTSGDADVSSWPGTNAVGSGFRGGSWGGYASDVRLSDRDYAAVTTTGRYSIFGGRCVRTSP